MTKKELVDLLEAYRGLKSIFDYYTVVGWPAKSGHADVFEELTEAMGRMSTVLVNNGAQWEGTEGKLLLPTLPVGKVEGVAVVHIGSNGEQQPYGPAAWPVSALDQQEVTVGDAVGVGLALYSSGFLDE